MTIDELNRRYGAPGRIVFRTGFAGYPEVVLANKFGTAEIATRRERALVQADGPQPGHLPS